MLKYPITYNTFDGQELTEDFYFNLTKAEMMKMELGVAGGLTGSINKAIAGNDTPAILEIFEKLILGAYGVKSDDGKHFHKIDPKTGIKYADLFKDSEAYSVLFMKLATDEKEASKFINGIVPADVVEQSKAASKAKHPAVK